MSLYIRVKYLCKENGMTLKELAEKMGVVKNQLYKHLRKNPTLKTIERIAEAIGVQPSELLGDDDFFGMIHYKNKTHKVDTYQSFLELSKSIEDDVNNSSTEHYTISTSKGKTFKVKDIEELKKLISDLESSENN